MNKLPCVPAPYPGEWLGFWLHRVAAPYGLDLEALLRHLGVEPRDKGPRVTWGRFTDLGVSAIRAVANALEVHPLRLRAMQRRISVNGPHMQLGCCATCLREDRYEGRPLHWRRNWMDPYATFCDRHRAQLVPVDAASVRPCRTARETERLLDELAAISAAADHWGADAAFSSMETLLRALQREARSGGRQHPRCLRRLVDRIAVNATSDLEFAAGTDAHPRSMPTFIWTHTPSNAGAFAAMRSLRQRDAAFRLVARVLEPHAHDVRAEVWAKLDARGRTCVAEALIDATGQGYALAWSEAEEATRAMVRRTTLQSSTTPTFGTTVRKSSVIRTTDRALAKC